MTAQHTHGAPPQLAGGAGYRHSGHRGHRWMMIACCIPMIAIFVALWLAGVIPAAFLLFALACTALMALAMGGMSHDEASGRGEQDRR